MERKKISEFPQEVLNLFDLFIHGDINRRDFVDAAGKIVGTVAAAAMLESLSPNYAMAQQIAPDDKRIKASTETFDSPNGTGKITGYLVRPANATGKIPGVLVVHENRGLNPYVKDVVRRLAVAGFMAFGPDALSSLGGYPSNWPSYVPGKSVDAQEVSTADQKATQMQGSLDGKKLIEDWETGARWLKGRPDCTGRIGVVGFCYGGGICNTSPSAWDRISPVPPPIMVRNRVRMTQPRSKRNFACTMLPKMPASREIGRTIRRRSMRQT